MTLSQIILTNNEDVLTRMLAHPFVEDVCADRLAKDVFHRYLVYEGAFVETAIAIFAHAVAKAPDIEARRWLIGVLDALANTQIPYFQGCFDRLGLQTTSDLPEDVVIFRDGMLQIAEQGDFLKIATAMFAAEWMYWKWCARAAKCYISDPDLRAWVVLHVKDEFAAQASWLKNVIDQHGSTEDEARLSKVFRQATELEITFHHAPYDSEPDSRSQS